MTAALDPDILMTSGRFASAAGQRDYLLFLPNGCRPPRGLVVMLHGCKQTPADFAAGTRMNTRAAAEGFAVLWPAQGRADNASGCWNWYRPDHQKRGFGEPAILADMTRDMIARYDIPAHQIFCAGLSAGGAMALILRETYPDLFAAVAAHSGVAPGIATNGIAAMSAMRGNGTAPTPRPEMRVPALVLHGTEDDVVHPSNADAVAPPVERRFLPGLGHAWSGGSPKGSFTDPNGPEVTGDILTFFLSSTETSPKQALSRLARRTGLA